MSIESPMDVQIGGGHYKSMAIQPMEYSMANKLDACQHTAIKYITRFREKGGIQDLEKAKHVIDMLIHFEQRGVEVDTGVAAKAAADVDLQQMRSAGTPINPADVDISDNSHPRWKDAPDWANWLAQDGDGSWYWYEQPIYAHEDDDAWYEQKGFDGRIDDAGEDAERNPDWRNTRHARPTK